MYYNMCIVHFILWITLRWSKTFTNLIFFLKLIGYTSISIDVKNIPCESVIVQLVSLKPVPQCRLIFNEHYLSIHRYIVLSIYLSIDLSIWGNRFQETHGSKVEKNQIFCCIIITQIYKSSINPDWEGKRARGNVFMNTLFVQVFDWSVRVPAQWSHQPRQHQVSKFSNIFCVNYIVVCRGFFSKIMHTLLGKKMY